MTITAVRPARGSNPTADLRVEYFRLANALSTSKQDTLVSGTTIKTINGSALLGSGNLVVSAAVTAQQATLDFGALSYDAKVSVIDASVTSSTRIMLSLTVDGRDADELEMAPMVLSSFVTPGVGFDIYAHALQGADGQFKVNYMKA